MFHEFNKQMLSLGYKFSIHYFLLLFTSPKKTSTKVFIIRQVNKNESDIFEDQKHYSYL